MLMMRVGLARCAVVCGAAWLSAPALGQSLQTLPPANDSAAGDSGNSIPLANYTAGTYQVMYGADLLTGIPSGSVITGMQVRLDKSFSSAFPNAAYTVSRYEVTLATSALTPATMSTNFATNMTGPVVVRSGSMSVAANAYQWLNNGAGVPEPWGPVIAFTTGYAYKGGPLVILLRVESPSSTFAAYADQAASGTSQREVHSSGDSNATTASFQNAGGLIVRLTFTPPATDLAKGVTKVIMPESRVNTTGNTGEGVLTWNSAFTQEVAAAANQFDTIGPGSDFVGMAWRLQNAPAWPAAAANYTQLDVQLSKSNNGPGVLSQTVANNVGADAVTVRSGAFSFPIGSFQPKGSATTAPFGPTIAFASAYHYRGGPLLSVVRHSGQGSGLVSFMDCLYQGDPTYNIEAQGWQAPGSAAAVTTSNSGCLTTMYSVDAGTSSPLNQLSPGAGFLTATGEVPNVLQTVLSASELKYIPPGSVIDSLWLRQSSTGGAAPSADVASANFELSVSTATAPPAGMGTNFAANEGMDKVVVYGGGLLIPANAMPAGSNGNFGKIVQFQKSFVYKGGPLCITIRHTGLSGSLGLVEAVFGTGSTNRSAFSFSAGAPTGSYFGGGYTGLPLKLGYIPSVMTPNSLATAEGSSAWNLPFISSYAVQTIIPASQLKTVTVGSAITGFSLRGDGFNATGIPATDTNLTQFDVSIAPATHGPLAISTTYANNIGAGEVIVRSGPMTVPANAYPALGTPRENAWYVPFTRAYVYTGGDLCVTFRGQGALAGGGGLYIDGQSNVPQSTGASIYEYTNSAATTGATWGPIAMRLAFTQRAYCPCDLNNDGVVEDADFSIFVLAYNILDCADGGMPFGCPADFNYDGVVDDADFQIFVVAYNNLICP